MKRALSEYVVAGIRTNLAFHEAVLSNPEFIAGRYDTGFVERNHDALNQMPLPSEEEQLALVVAGTLAASTTRAASRVGDHASSSSSNVSPWVAAHRARLR